MPKEKIIEAVVPIHAWLIKRANYDPSLRQRIEAELGRKAFEVAKEEAKN